MKNLWQFLIIGLSLWCLWALRAYNILALPAFVDESLHIMRAQVVFNFSDAVASFLPGKLLTYYYFGLFDPQNESALWLTRQAIALLAPLSGALCFALVKTLTRSFWAGLFALWLYALTPMLFFFERMALSDPFALVFVLGLVWTSILLAKQPSRSRALIAGLLLGFALLAKLTTLPFIAAPVLAILCFAKHNTRLSAKAKILALVYLIAGVVLFLPAAYVVYQEVAQLEDKQEVVTTALFIPEEQSRLEQVEHNLRTYEEAVTRLNPALIFLMILAIGGTWFKKRENGYLWTLFALSWGFILLASAFPSTRYLTVSFPIFLVISAIGSHALLQKAPSIFGKDVVMGSLIGLAIFASIGGGLLFAWDAWRNPTLLQLGDQDEWEYFRHISSSYPLRDGADYLLAVDEPQVPVVGAIGNCHSLRFYLPKENPIKLYCPFFRFYDNPALLTFDEWTIYASRAEYAYFLSEAYTPDADNPSDIEIIAKYQRPHDGVSTWLLRAPLSYTDQVGNPDEQ